MKLHDHQELAVRALENMKGDNTARVKLAFRNYSPEQMNNEYRQSGKTCAEILAECEAHDAKFDAAIKWVSTAR